MATLRKLGSSIAAAFPIAAPRFTFEPDRQPRRYPLVRRGSSIIEHLDEGFDRRIAGRDRPRRAAPSRRRATGTSTTSSSSLCTTRAAEGVARAARHAQIRLPSAGSVTSVPALPMRPSFPVHRPWSIWLASWFAALALRAQPLAPERVGCSNRSKPFAGRRQLADRGRPRGDRGAQDAHGRRRAPASRSAIPARKRRRARTSSPPGTMATLELDLSFCSRRDQLRHLPAKAGMRSSYSTAGA